MKYSFVMFIWHKIKIYCSTARVTKTEYKDKKKVIYCKPRLFLSKGQLRHF